MKTLPQIEREYDRLFSLYIRQLYAIDGITKCATCGGVFTIREIHCGHFQERKHKATRWDKRNCLPQCCKCNTFRQGEQYKMAKAIDKIFGQGTADLMETLSRTTCKNDKFSLEYRIKELKNEMIERKMLLR
jgi:hypothetical protein